MRAICEACDKPQPPSWQPGELCVHCGAAVRTEARCFWCVKWTPASGAKYCRSCGAEVVPQQQFGAARMLKDAGTDRFNVPKMLRELDPDQIANFSRIYQRHQVALTRHVDELRYLEERLFQHGFSDRLEEELLPQLPWPEATLAQMSSGVSPLVNSEGLPAVQAIEKTSPFATTRALATLARVRLEDWEAVRGAVAVFRETQEGDRLRSEAALVLSSWQVATAVGPTVDSRALHQALTEPTLAAALPQITAVRRARFQAGEEAALQAALAGADADTAFAAALIVGDIDRLTAALQGPELMQMAAGRRLIQLGHYGGIDKLLRAGSAPLRAELIDALRSVKGPVPELAEAVLFVFEQTADLRQRARITDVLCRRLNPAWVPRICEAAGNERSIFQSLFMEKAELPQEAIGAVCKFMLDHGRFTMSQYGLSDAAQRGALADSFVPTHFPQAPDDASRKELLRCAEEQLKERGDEALHRFVMGEVFGPHTAEVRAAAWWALSRWYAQTKYAWNGPFSLRVTEIERFFGSLANFLPRWIAVLQDADTMKEVGYYDYMAHLLKYSETDLAPALAADPALIEPTQALVHALIGVIDSDYWALLRSAAAEFLGAIGSHAAWRESVLTGLHRCRDKGNFDLQYACDRAIKTITGEPSA